MSIMFRGVKITLCVVICLALLTACFKKISFVDKPYVNLCSTSSAANRLFELIRGGNYWLMQAEVSKLEAKFCPAYHLTDRTVYVLKTTEINQGKYSELIFFEAEFTDIGKRYGWLLKYRASGLYVGAIKAIFEDRTESGLGDLFNELLK